MSGFEVVGVILAVWPLVINGIQLYKSCKAGQGWSLLLTEFKTEGIIYTEFVCHLLAADVSEADLRQLTARNKPNQGLWKDKKLNNGLKERLGVDKSEVVISTLEEMDKLLTSLTRRFGVDQVELESPPSRIRRGLQNLQMNLPASAAKDELKKLRNLNNRLQRLLCNTPGPNSSTQSRQQPKTSSALPPEVLNRISANANVLHDALVDNYNCDCDVAHEANLGSRLVSADDLGFLEPLELLFPVCAETVKELTDMGLPSPTSMGEKSPDAIEFDTLTLSDASPPRPWHPRYPPERSWSQRASISTIPTSLPSPGTSPPPFRGRKISLSKSDGMEPNNLIEDLCAFIKNLAETEVKSAPLSCLGILGHREKRYAVNVTSLDGDGDLEEQPKSFVCLEDYLSPHRSWNLSRQKRMDLALSLSLAILQFVSTPWVDKWWSFRDFCMLKGDKSQIFVTKKFYSTQISATATRIDQPIHSPQMSTFWDCIGEPILTRLGFALVELALGKRLSDLRAQGSDPNLNDMLDLAAALKLVDEGQVLQEAGQCYHNAVHACLTHQIVTAEGVKGLNSQHAKFQADLENFVVAPVREFYLSSWKPVQMVEA